MIQEHIEGFAVIRPNGSVMLAQTFATDLCKCLARFHFGNYSTMTWADCMRDGYRVGVVSVEVEAKEGDDMEKKLASFRDSVKHAHSEFLKNKDDLSDLSPRFWVAWLNLEIACEPGVSFDDLKSEVLSCCKHFGSPGDFGYGTPCGDSLLAVYDAWRSVVAEHSMPTA